MSISSVFWALLPRVVVALLFLRFGLRLLVNTVYLLYAALHIIFPASGAHATWKGSYTDRVTGMTVGVLHARLDTRSDSFARLKPGYAFAMLDVEERNDGRKPHDYIDGDFSMSDQSGRSWEVTAYLPQRYAQLYFGTLTPGDSVEGWIGAQVPRGTTRVTVRWNDHGDLLPARSIATYALR